jgi:DNA polymerase-3 subunit delta'
VIEVPGQPLAQRILRAAVGGERPAQQLLLFGPPGTGKRRAAVEAAWALMDPAGEHRHTAEALDLTVVEAVGQQILLRDLEAALAQIAARPTVMARRVMIVQGAERLREQEGAPRLLKTLEEPPPLSHVVLVSDRPADLLDTIRSRCLPVPFRSAGWRATADAGSPFQLAMRAIGVELALAALAGEAPSPGGLVREIQRRMESVADANPSDELLGLRGEAAALDGKRGGRTAAKRAEDQEKRERRRMVTDGWTLVLDSAAATAADALAVAVGAEGAARHPERLEQLRELGRPERREFLERAVAEMQLTRSELVLNPSADLAVEGLLVRIEAARHGRAPARLVAPGRLRSRRETRAGRAGPGR